MIIANHVKGWIYSDCEKCAFWKISVHAYVIRIYRKARFTVSYKLVKQFSHLGQAVTSLSGMYFIHKAYTRIVKVSGMSVTMEEIITNPLKFLVCSPEGIG